jgi:hypothetical protein
LLREPDLQAMNPFARHGIIVNVDFHSGGVDHLLRMKRDLFVPQLRRPA